MNVKMAFTITMTEEEASVIADFWDMLDNSSTEFTANDFVDIIKQIATGEENDKVEIIIVDEREDEDE